MRRIFTAETCRSCLTNIWYKLLYYAVIFFTFVLLLHPTFADKVLSIAERYLGVIKTLIKFW